MPPNTAAQNSYIVVKSTIVKAILVEASISVNKKITTVVKAAAALYTMPI
jgi:hypothetical protein